MQQRRDRIALYYPPTAAEVAALAARLGGQSALARRLGVGRDVAWRWVHGQRPPTGPYARALRRLMAEQPSGDP